MESNPLLPHLIVAQHLRTHGFLSTLQAFQSDAAKAGIALPALESGSDNGVDQSEAAALIDPQYELPNLLAAFQAHQEQLRLEAEARAQAQAQRVALQSALSHLLSLSLPGPRTLPFYLKATHRTLHAANILSILAVQWPSRRFLTASARFETVERRAIATTAADRRVVISDPESGEMLECLESGSPGAGRGHQAAVLSTAQNPKLARELVSTSMDSTVLVWDLLAGGGRPIQVMKDHSRFVVKAAYSQDGRFLATAGYDRKIIIYQREPFATVASSRSPAEAEGQDEEEEDDPEPEPLEAPFKLAYTVDTLGGNPEALVFLQTASLPLPDQGVPGTTPRTKPGQNDAIVTAEEVGFGRERTWLAFSCRGECHINYLAIPRLEQQASVTTSEQEQQLHSQINNLSLVEADASPASASGLTTSQNDKDVEDWTLVKCNTNENPDDWHVSYSLLSLALHPSGTYLSAQTGDHARPSSTTTTGAGASAYMPAPRIFLLEPLRPGRVHTLFLPPHHNPSSVDAAGATSLSPAPRHAWILPRGEALWVSGDDGRVRLIDVHLLHPGANATLRAEVWTQGRPDDVDEEWSSQVDASSGADEIRIQNEERRASAMWGRGGNTVIKDLCVLDEQGSLATCGFDRTVRIVGSKLAGVET
ncbi:hypothetical protein OC845_003058 [Tilletia horrida]|nr:hypothetical protein OC845_003058 [Tilletia horrida]